LRYWFTDFVVVANRKRVIRAHIEGADFKWSLQFQKVCILT
jgi:hypothetical protein